MAQWQSNANSMQLKEILGPFRNYIISCIGQEQEQGEEQEAICALYNLVCSTSTFRAKNLIWFGRIQCKSQCKSPRAFCRFHFGSHSISLLCIHPSIVCRQVDWLKDEWILREGNVTRWNDLLLLSRFMSLNHPFVCLSACLFVYSL